MAIQMPNLKTQIPPSLPQRICWSIPAEGSFSGALTRFAFIFFALLPFSNGIIAQQDSLTTLAFGFGGGAFSSQVNLTNTLRAENDILMVNGVQLGGSLRYFNNKIVGFVGEVNYSQGGWAESADSLTGNYSRQFDYLELQILTQFAFGRKAIRPILQAGPYVSFPIAQSDEVPSDFPIPDEENYYGVELPFRVNYGLSVGAGIYLALGPIGVQLEGRAIFGVSDLVKSGSLGVSTSRRQAFGGRVTVFYELP